MQLNAKMLRGYWSRLKQHRLVTTASVYVSGYVIQKAVSFLLIPIWARFLTPQDYGITGTLLAYGGVLAVVLGLGLSGAVVRHYYDYTADHARLTRYITSVILFQIVGPGLLVLALDAWGAALWARFTANTIPFHPYVRVMLWATYVDMLSQIPISLYQAQQRARQFVYVQYSRFLLGVATSVLFVIALRLGALGVLLSQLVAGTLVSATVLYLVGRTWFTRRISWRYVREALGYGLPLVPHALASWVLQAADRLILERHVSLAELGLYNFGYTLGMSMQFLVMGINQAWMPHYFRLMKADHEARKKVVRVTSIYVALVGGACLLGVLFAGDIIRLLMPASFLGSARYVPPILTGYLLLGLYYLASAPLFFLKQTRVIPLLTGSAAAVNILGNVWLVPDYGAMASAWVTMITYGLLFLLAYLVGQRYARIAYPQAKYGFFIGLILLATVAATPLGAVGLPGISAKAALITLYATAAYLILLRPQMERTHE
jgi:O-antigen/teichoic acid export membrane protein